MTKYMKQRSKKSGLPPGTLIHIGDKKCENVSITMTFYNEDKFEEMAANNLQDIKKVDMSQNVTWINVDGLHDTEVLNTIGDYFGLHPLVLEDILNTDQRAKYEDYGEYLYIVLKMFYLAEETREIIVEQTSLILGSNFVLSFGEKEGDVFNSIRDRIRNGIGRIRKSGADFLIYSLLDAIVDNYFIVLEKLGDKLEITEELLVDKPTTDTLQVINRLKREMLFLHKSIWPLREVIGAMERRESQLIQDTTQLYLRDIYDHVIQVMDTTEIYRDILSGMLDIYLSSISNKMNEVMKVLTVISTIFIPLTFIVGVYGMNFKYMPELEQPLGYPLVWLSMIILAISMLTYFKRKKWF